MIMLDEVENVLRATRRARRESYTVLRELIDNVDDRHGMMNVCFYVSGTPDLFEGAQGLTEYEALATRTFLPGDTGTNPRAPLVDLSLFPLVREDFVEIAHRISQLYSVTNPRRIPSDLEQTIQNSLDDFLENPAPSARLWVRSVVDMFDRVPNNG